MGSVFPTKINNSNGLLPLIRAAVGPTNTHNVHSAIVPERFKLTNNGQVRIVDLEIARFLKGETGEKAARRLDSSGYNLENIGELAHFLFGYPQEVEKFAWVVALGEDSRGEDDGDTLVPYVRVAKESRFFHVHWLKSPFDPVCGVLVSRKR